jgi:hypothetical protein
MQRKRKGKEKKGRISSRPQCAFIAAISLARSLTNPVASSSKACYPASIRKWRRAHISSPARPFFSGLAPEFSWRRPCAGDCDLRSDPSPMLSLSASVRSGGEAHQRSVPREPGSPAAADSHLATGPHLHASPLFDCTYTHLDMTLKLGTVMRSSYGQSRHWKPTINNTNKLFNSAARPRPVLADTACR